MSELDSQNGKKVVMLGQCQMHVNPEDGGLITLYALKPEQKLLRISVNDLVEAAEQAFPSMDLREIEIEDNYSESSVLGTVCVMIAPNSDAIRSNAEPCDGVQTHDQDPEKIEYVPFCFLQFSNLGDLLAQARKICENYEIELDDVFLQASEEEQDIPGEEGEKPTKGKFVDIDIIVPKAKLESSGVIDRSRE